MEQWIRENFVVDALDDNEVFKSMDSPESWTDLETFLQLFGAIDAPPTRETLRAAEGGTGFGYVFDDWQDHGLIQ